MRSPTLDPTAGERARQIAAHPGIGLPIADATDPRYGDRPRSIDGQAETWRIVDPTDPGCSRPRRRRRREAVR